MVTEDADMTKEGCGKNATPVLESAPNVAAGTDVKDGPQIFDF